MQGEFSECLRTSKMITRVPQPSNLNGVSLQKWWNPHCVSSRISNAKLLTLEWEYNVLRAFVVMHAVAYNLHLARTNTFKDESELGFHEIVPPRKCDASVGTFFNVSKKKGAKKSVHMAAMFPHAPTLWGRCTLTIRLPPLQEDVLQTSIGFRQVEVPFVRFFIYSVINTGLVRLPGNFLSITIGAFESKPNSKHIAQRRYLHS